MLAPDGSPQTVRVTFQVAALVAVLAAAAQA
jgi:hypothetical protein